MTREEIEIKMQENPSDGLLLELPTSYGKTRLALQRMDYLLCEEEEPKILIVVPRVVLYNEWQREIKKWGYEKYLPFIGFSTYVSFPKHAEQYDFVIFDECFKGDTEILTENGYIRFDQLKDGVKIAQWDDDGSIEFVNPIRLIKKPYNGDLKKVHLGRGRFVFMTPNHNQVYSTKSDTSWRVKPIKDLKFHHATYIPVSGKGTGNNEMLSPIERLLIAIQADGTLQKHQKNESVYSIQLTKDRKKDRIQKILSELNIWTKIGCKRPNTDRYMCKLPKGDAKLLSTHFNLNMGYDRANDFIKEVLEWDGSYLQGSSVYYSSKIKENADFVAAVAIQAGYKVLQGTEEDNRKESYSTIHRVYMRKLSKINTQAVKSYDAPYNGFVYCVEVPSHKIVVRSQGYSFVSGNCHHLSDRCIEHFSDMLTAGNIKQYIMLSATVGRNKKAELFEICPSISVIQVSVKTAIQSDILPDPKVYLIPLKLNDKTIDCEIVKNKRIKTQPIRISFKDRFKYKSVKNRRIEIYCTQKQYYDETTNLIEWYRRRSHQKVFKNMFLKASGDRLKWLSDIKTGIVYRILDRLKDKRTLTFCNSIKQTELLGKYCINSKNKNSKQHLDRFNKSEINHITACDMVNEGCNLYDCQIGVYASLHSSDRLVKQQLGRLLRHPNPVLIIPYYENTRDEEIVNKMLEDYNPELVKKVTDLSQIKIKS